MNVPTLITLVRMVLVPLLICLLFQGAFQGAICLFLAAGITDALDGCIARRFNLCTRLGAILDPLADKLLIFWSVMALTLLGHLPWWLAVAIVGRDIVIIGGAVAFRLRCGSLDMAPSIFSKLNTLIQICLIALLLLHLSNVIDAALWLPPMFALAFITATVSGVHYVVVWGRKARAQLA